MAAIPLSERLANLDALSWAVDRLTEVSLVMLVGGLIKVIAEADKLIAVPSHGDSGLPSHAVLALKRSAVEGDLDASVAHLAYVSEGRAVEVWRSGDVILPEHVGSVLVIEIDTTTDAAIEEAEVETDVNLLADLPLEVGVRIRGNDEGLLPLTIVIVISVAESPAGEAGVAVRGDDTRHTEACAELEVRDPVGIIHEALVRDSPAKRCRREVTPLVVLTELRAALTTEGEKEIVAVGIAIGYAAEETDELAVVLIAAHASLTFLEIAADAEVVVLEIVG